MALPLELTEYQDCVRPGSLNTVELQALAAAHISVAPSVDSPGSHVLRPSSWVGAVNIGDWSVIVRPKIRMDRAMFLLMYALDPIHWRNEAIDLAPDANILEAVAMAFSRRTQRAIHRGLLRGYRREEDAHNTMRGQIRFADQIRRRYGLPLPIELAYDEYTEDIEHNRLLKTAIHRLSHAQIRSTAVRKELRRLRSAFGMVQLGRYRRGAVPRIRFTRLDEHYRPAVELARLVIENTSLELLKGRVSGISFLIDMNQVFEQFLYVALGEALNLTNEHWQQQARLKLDKAGSIGMEPDLSWWEPATTGSAPRARFVGDAKYKKLDAPGFRHADIYQMLAYCTAANLPSGMLIYAADAGGPAEYRILNSGKTIEVAALDLSGAPETILGDVKRLAKLVRRHVR